LANQRSISRLLSLMLRHRPDEFGLEIDQYGFVPLDQVAQAIQDRYEEVREEDVLELLNSPGQYRFELGEKGVRALYGHTFFVEMDGEPMDPPERFYMGTTTAAARRFKTEGIGSGDRFYVHLSLSREVAESRSREPDSPCVAEILAQQAAQGGVEFYERGEVVLTRQVPGEFVGEIHGLAEQAKSEGSDRSKVSKRSEGSDRSKISKRSESSDRKVTPPAGEMTYGRKPRKATR
jgi:putative RNA 2'-phosphotransferase